MQRPLTVCLLAAAASFACVIGPEEQPGDDSTTGAPTIGETTAPEPTTDPTTTTTTPDPTTSGTTDTGASATTERPPECFPAQLEVEPVIPRVMLVLDKSGSMANLAGHWDHDGDDADDDGVVDGTPNTPATPTITRWRSLHATVDAVVHEFDGRMDFGAVLFPAVEASNEYGVAACPVHAAPDVPLGGDQADVIVAALPAADSATLFGGTPAAAAITTGVAGLLADVGSSAPRYLVLVTDGAANCPIEPQDDKSSSLFEIYDDNLPVVVADALASGIPTFVVGIAIADEVSATKPDGNPDATNTFERLNEVAEAGGRARDGAEKFHGVRDQSQLDAALREVAASVTSCAFVLPSGLPLLHYLDEVVVGGRDPLIYGQEQVRDCASESGWRFTDRTMTGLELCGEACARYRQSGELEIRFDCRAD